MNLPFYLGFRYTGAKQRSRSVAFLSRVSMLGLAVGVALLVLVLSVMNGFDRELRQRILGLVPQAAIYQRGGIKDWRSLEGELSNKEGVVAASPFVQLDGLVSHKNNSAFVSFYGVDIQAEKNVSLIGGFVETAVQERLANGEKVLLLGRSVAEKLSLGVGDRVMVVVPSKTQQRRSPKIDYFEIVQLINTQTELDATLALTNLEHAAALSGSPGKVSGVRLKLTDLFYAPQIVYSLTSELGFDYYGSDWTRTHWNLYQAIQMSKSLVGLLMSLIVAIAAFNVVATLVLVVIDKQGDIAILRTLGASSGRIMATFVVMGAAIGAVGTLVGVIAGCGLSIVAQPFVALVESIFGYQFLHSDVYPLTYVPTEIRFADLVFVSSIALVMSFVATLYPAWKAARVAPAEALRYE